MPCYNHMADMFRARFPKDWYHSLFRSLSFNQGDFSSQRWSNNVLRHFFVVIMGVCYGTYWVKTKDAAQCLVQCRRASISKTNQAPSVNSVEIVESWSRSQHVCTRVRVCVWVSASSFSPLFRMWPWTSHPVSWRFSFLMYEWAGLEDLKLFLPVISSVPWYLEFHSLRLKWMILSPI